MNEPKSRYGTRKAIEELSIELNLRHEDWMQDWPYEVVREEDIERFIQHYYITTDEDKKFVLMEAIIQANSYQRSVEEREKYWVIVKSLLQHDFKLHEYTIFYWCCFETENIEDCFAITPYIRALWAENRKTKLLFVCTVNRMRSATAHQIFEKDKRFEVKSAGTDKTAATVISKELLDWADSIVVMETHHRNYIREKFQEIYANKKIVCLYIPDEYEFMQMELINILREKIEDVYKRQLI